MSYRRTPATGGSFPAEVLSSILQHLAPKDRASAECVCLLWCQDLLFWKARSQAVDVPAWKLVRPAHHDADVLEQVVLPVRRWLQNQIKSGNITSLSVDASGCGPSACLVGSCQTVRGCADCGLIEDTLLLLARRLSEGHHVTMHLQLADNPLGQRLLQNRRLLDCLCPVVTSLEFHGRPFWLTGQGDGVKSDPREELRRLSQLTGLQVLTLSFHRNARLVHRLSSKWAALTRLRALSIRAEATIIHRDSIKVASQLQALSSLTELRLSHVNMEMMHLQHLRALECKDCDSGGVIIELAGLTALTRLALSGICCVRGEEEDTTELARLACMQHLQVHALRGAHLRTMYWAFWKAAAGMPALTHLQLSAAFSTDMSDSWSASLEDLSALRQLRTLTLDRLEMMQGGRACLPSSLTLLQHLQLSNMNLLKFERVPFLSSLTALSLEDNHLSSLPADFGHLVSMKSLSLRGNCFKTLPMELSHLAALTCLCWEDQKCVGFQLREHLPLQSWPRLRYLLLRQRPLPWRSAEILLSSLPHVPVEIASNPLSRSESWDKRSLEVIGRAADAARLCSPSLTLVTDKHDWRDLQITSSGVSLSGAREPCVAWQRPS